jgi:hypothetical protein
MMTTSEVNVETPSIRKISSGSTNYATVSCVGTEGLLSLEFLRNFQQNRTMKILLGVVPATQPIAESSNCDMNHLTPCSDRY